MCEEVHQPPHSLLRAAEETPVSRANIPRYRPTSTFKLLCVTTYPSPGITT